MKNVRSAIVPRAAYEGLLAALLGLFGLAAPLLTAAQENASCPPANATQVASYATRYGQQKALAAKSPDWGVQLIRWEPATWPPQQFEFEIRNVATKATSHITVPAWGPDKNALQLHQIDQVNIFADRLLVVGRQTANFSEADVLELPSGIIVDQFRCFMPAVSPDRHFIAFIKPFPGHPGPVSVTAEYLVYDLTESPEFNRSRSKSGVTYDAGLPVYPPGATNAPGSNVVPGTDSPVHWIASDQLYWLDPTTLAFADRYEREVDLVTVKLRGGLYSPQARTAVLNRSLLLDLSQCRNRYSDEDMKKIAHDPSALIHLQQIAPAAGHPGYVCLRLETSACLTTASLMVKVP